MKQMMMTGENITSILIRNVRVGGRCDCRAILGLKYLELVWHHVRGVKWNQVEYNQKKR